MFGDSGIEAVAAVFFQEPEQEHYLAESSRAADLAHTSVKQHLKTLLDHGLIERTVEQRGSREFPRYHASMSRSFSQHKRRYTHQRLYQSGLIEHLDEELMPDVIVLFGSAQRGEDTTKSDIDLFVQCAPADIDLSRFEDELGRPIELHCAPELNDVPDALMTNICNGDVLMGYLDHGNRPSTGTSAAGDGTTGTGTTG